MGLFKPDRTEVTTPAEPVTTPVGKQGPTPTRREAEAARRERLNPTLTPKQARARERSAKSEERNSQLVRAEAHPGRTLVRDFVDSRRAIAGWSMPLLMGTLLLSLLVTSMGPTAVSLVSYFTWAMFALIGLDIVRTWRSYKKLHAARIPHVPLKGLLPYTINRSIQLRRLRTPSPRVSPGDEI